MATAINQPTHLVYHVEEREGNESNHWTKVGAMWPHKDGKGWNLQLDLLPIGSTGKLTIRVNEPREANKTT